MSIEETVVGELAKKVPVEKIYDDGFRSAVIEVGLGLKRAVKLVLAPVTALAWGYDKIAAYLDSAIPAYFESRNIGEEKIISPDIAVAIPAIEAMRYTKDEIRTKLLNLLGASMNSDTAEFVHPAFVEILKQMTPDEAKLLNQLPREFLYEPIMDIAVAKPQTDGVFTLFSSVGVIGEEAHCEFPDKTPLYLTNLTRLGLVDIPGNIALADSWRYDKIRKSPAFLEKVELAEKEGKVLTIKKMVGITSMGSDLRKASI